MSWRLLAASGALPICLVIADRVRAAGERFLGQGQVRFGDCGSGRSICIG